MGAISDSHSWGEDQNKDTQNRRAQPGFLEGGGQVRIVWTQWLLKPKGEGRHSWPVLRVHQKEVATERTSNGVRLLRIHYQQGAMAKCMIIFQGRNKEVSGLSYWVVNIDLPFEFRWIVCAYHVRGLLNLTLGGQPIFKHIWNVSFTYTQINCVIKFWIIFIYLGHLLIWF